MDEELEAASVLYKQNEESIDDLQDITKQKDKDNDEIEKPVKAEDIFEEANGDLEYHDAEASDHP